MTVDFIKARLEVLRDHLRGQAVDQQQAANTVQEGVECIVDLLNDRDVLFVALEEAREALAYYANIHPIAESAITQAMTARDAIATVALAIAQVRS